MTAHWVILRVLVFLPLLGLTCVSFSFALQFSCLMSLSRSFELLSALALWTLTAGLAWQYYRSALKTWRIHRGLEPAPKLGAVLGLLLLLGVLLLLFALAYLVRSGNELQSKKNLGAIRSGSLLA